MPNCNVYGCTNQTEHGFVMKQIPSSEERRKEWLQHLKIDGASITDALVCEAHFPPQMWEDTKDGYLRMLKHDAVPTLFEYRGDEIPRIPYSKARKCAALGCNNRDGFFRLPSITLHKFPLDSGDEELLKKWNLAAGQLDYTSSETSYMCSDHFKPNQLQGEKTERTLVPGAYPTIYKSVKVAPNVQRLPVISQSSSLLNPYIEIQGLHQVQQNVNGDVLRIALFFGVELRAEDIDRCLIFKKKSTLSGEKTLNTIIVKFSNLSKKLLLLDAYKNSVKTLMDTERNAPITITDEISPANKKLLMITEKLPVNEIKTSEVVTGEKTTRNIVYKKIVKTITPQPSARDGNNRPNSKSALRVSNAKKTSKVNSKQAVSSCIQQNQDSSKIENESSCSKNMEKESIQLSKSTTEKSVENLISDRNTNCLKKMQTNNITKDNVKMNKSESALGTSEITLDESIEKTLESMGLEVETTANVAPPSYAFEDEKDLVEEALESFGLNIEAVERQVPIKMDRHGSQGSKRDETITNNVGKDKGSNVNSKETTSEEGPPKCKQRRKTKTSLGQPDPESMEVDIKIDEDEVIVDHMVGRYKRSSNNPTIESNGSSLDEEDLQPKLQKEESGVKDEPDSSLDSFTYKMLKDSAAQCKVEVKLERLDEEIVQQYQSAATSEISKPFKKRFSTEHLEETLPEPGPSPNKIIRSKKSKTDLNNVDDNLFICRSKRKVVKPQKYKEFDCNFPRTSNNINYNEKTEEVECRRKRILILRHRDSNKFKTVAQPSTQKADNPFLPESTDTNKLLPIERESDELKTTPTPSTQKTAKQFGCGPSETKKAVSIIEKESDKVTTTARLSIQKADQQLVSRDRDTRKTALLEESSSDKMITMVQSSTLKADKQVVASHPHTTKDKEEHLQVNRKRKISDTTKSSNNSSGDFKDNNEISKKVGRLSPSQKSGTPVASTSSQPTVEGPIFNLSNVRSSLKEKLGNKVSNVTKKAVPGENATSSVTIVPSVTPIGSNTRTGTPGSSTGKSNSVIEGGVPGLTSIAIPVSNYSPPETIPPANFKLITTFEQLIGHLKEKHLLKSHVEDFLIKNFSHFELYKLMRCKDNNRTSTKYSRLQTRFALVLYLFSLDCYKYVCSVFSLPHDCVLQNAILSSNFQPGILVESLDLINQKLKELGGSESINPYLVIDLVPIKRNVIWDEGNDTFIGYTHLFETFDYHNSTATQVVFIMLCFLNEHLNIPVAYFPVDYIYPEFLASVIKLLVGCLFNRSVKPTCIVLDASSTSFSCAELLGCSVAPGSKLVSTFSHQASKLKVPIFFDIHHLAKEVRDWFSRIDVMDSKMGLVEWKYVQFLIEKLALKYSSDPELLANLFTDLKLDLDLAEAMEDQRIKGNTEFECSKPTVQFIKNIDKVLSAFDLRDRFSDSAPMVTGVNLQKWFFSDFCPYFEGLQVNSLSLRGHKKINFVNSCFYNMNSLCLLYDKIISNKLSFKRNLPKFKLTLDPIDMFFYFTFNEENNVGPPDCLTLKRGLEKYIGWIKSKNRYIERIPPLLANFRSNKRSHKKTSNNESIVNDKRSVFYVESLCRSHLKVYKECILILISNIIREYLVKRISCVNCLEMLNHTDKVKDLAEHNFISGDWQRHLTLLYDKPSIKASRDIFKIVQMCDKVFDQSKCTLNLFSISTKKVICTIIARTRTELFENVVKLPFSQFNHPVFDDDTYTTHENYLTTLIIKNYVHMRIDRFKPYYSILL